MLSTVLGLTVLVLLAVIVLPVPRVRRRLTGTARMIQAAVLAFLGACGTFFVQPQTAPDWLTTAYVITGRTVVTRSWADRMSACCRSAW
jgi:hypothetical protein